MLKSKKGLKMSNNIIENITLIILVSEFIITMLGLVYFANRLHKDIKNDEKIRKNS